MRLNPALASLVVQQSFPDNDNVVSRERARGHGDGANWSITVYAVCAVRKLTHGYGAGRAVALPASTLTA